MSLAAIGLVRGALTAVLFGAFLLLWLWAWSKARKAEFDAAARLPLDEPASADPATTSRQLTISP